MDELQKIGSPWVELPECQASYVIGLWSECGICMESIGVHGRVPIRLTWSEVDAYSRASARLSAWEAEQIMLMSKAYVGSYHASKEHMTPPPYERDDDDYIKSRNESIERLVDSTMEIPKV